MEGIADKDYFLDADGNLATDEESAATLLVRKGQEVSKETAEKYNLGNTGSSPAAGAEESEESGEKATAPTANKSATPAKNKGAK